jgi:pyruvate dehydrogenase E2 component (dihydrolipoyllysine-residue acetyltransferase)
VLVPAGGKAPVGALIGVIADANEDVGSVLAQAGAPAAAPSKAPSAPPAPTPSTSSAAPPAAAPPSATQPQPAARPVPAPRVETARPTTPPAEGGRVKASPLARSMAAQQNIPLASVSGSGPGGRIIKRDIEAWTRGGAVAAAPSAAPSAGPTAPTVTPGQEIPLSNMRRTIARRLAESKFTAPHFYVTVEIDMRAAVDVREQLVRGENTKVSINDLVVKACAKALTRFPMVNASLDKAVEKLVTHGEVHVGVAVTIPDGLITPVIRNADRKSLLEISTEIKELAARAREKKLRPEEFTGSTFTISNLGMYDVTEFTAIINPPESAILAVGAVRKLPVVVEDRIEVGQRMRVTLSSDHRVVDGVMAAQFLGEVRRLLENPVSLLV